MPLPSPFSALSAAGIDPTETPYGPAVTIPLAFLCKRSLALLCASRVLARMGGQATCGHVMQEAVLIEGKCRFSDDAAGRALSDVRQQGAAAGPKW